MPVKIVNSQYCLVLIFDSLLKKGQKSHSEHYYTTSILLIIISYQSIAAMHYPLFINFLFCFPQILFGLHLIKVIFCLWQLQPRKNKQEKFVWKRKVTWHPYRARKNRHSCLKHSWKQILLVSNDKFEMSDKLEIYQK